MPKIKLFWQKIAKSLSPGDSLASGSWGQLCPRTPKSPHCKFLAICQVELTASIQVNGAKTFAW